MELKVSKLVQDSKWKTGLMTFVMQLKIKYFVNDINQLRFNRRQTRIEKRISFGKFL